jgi:hypothetical protein
VDDLNLIGPIKMRFASEEILMLSNVRLYVNSYTVSIYNQTIHNTKTPYKSFLQKKIEIFETEDGVTTSCL